MNKLSKIKFVLFNSELFKNTSILLSGTALAQLIPILLEPILRRYYSPEIFGAYSVYLSLLGILIIVASFKYELAIILPKKDKEAANIFILSVILSFFFSIILLIIVLIWKKNICIFLNLSLTYVNYLYVIPLGTFLFSLYQSINFWLIRKKKFLAISQNKFIRRSFEGSGKIGFRFIVGTYGLVIGDILGHIANLVSGVIQAHKSGLNLKLINFNKLRYVSRKYIEYPKFNVIPSFLSACSYLLPAILINKFFSTEYAGFFDLSKLVLSIPLALIATSISNVLLQRVSEKYREKQSFVKEFIPIVIIVLLIAFTELFIISLWGADLFIFIFGKKWSLSGEISEILIWSFSISFITASFTSVFIAMKKIKIYSFWQLFYFICIMSLYFFRKYGFIDFLKVFVFIEIISYLIAISMIIVVMLKYELNLKRSLS